MKHQEDVCKYFLKCITCGRIKSSRHVCEGRWCLNCSNPVEMNHKCFILTEEERNQSKKKRKSNVDEPSKVESSKIEGYIFFDYESMNIDGDHIPNLIIAEKMCFDCINIWKIGDNIICKSDCGIKSFDNNDKFCQWLLKQKFCQEYSCIF